MRQTHLSIPSGCRKLNREKRELVPLLVLYGCCFLIGCSKANPLPSVTPTIPISLPSSTGIQQPAVSVTNTIQPIITVTPMRPLAAATLTVPSFSTPTKVKIQTQTLVSTEIAAPTVTERFDDPLKSLLPGQYVVFWRKNSWYVQGVKDSSAFPLMPVESLNSQASLSPDGNKVAFTTSRSEIAIYDLSTGKQTTYPDLIMRWVTRFDWSPDSNILLAGGYIGGPLGDNSFPTSEFDYPKELYMIRTQDGQAACLGCEGMNAEKGYYGEKPAWSPDGNWIAFIARVRASPYPFTKNLYLMSSKCIDNLPACSDQAIVLDNTAWVAPQWSVNNTLASSCIMGEKHGICVVDVSGSMRPRMVVDIDDLTEDNEMLQDIAWSPDGTQLVFTVRYGKVAVDPMPVDAFTDVWVVTIPGGKVINLTNTPKEDEWAKGWSPDSQYIVYSRAYKEEELANWEGIFVPVSDIYVVPASGGEEINITNTPDEREVFTGWVVIPNKFAAGAVYLITEAGNDLNVRASPSLNGGVLEKLKAGDLITILEGPVQADGYTWWKMMTADGVEGWAVDVPGWYAPVSVEATPTP